MRRAPRQRNDSTSARDSRSCFVTVLDRRPEPILIGAAQLAPPAADNLVQGRRLTLPPDWASAGAVTFRGRLMPLPRGFDVSHFIEEVDKRHDLRGGRVVFFDGATMSVLRMGPPVCQNGLVAVVIRKGSKQLVPTSAEISEARDQRFNAELLNLGLGCGGMVISWVFASGSAAAAPITGGASLIVTAVEAAAGAAGTIQCLNAGVRMINEVRNPQANVEFDDNIWYQRANTALDVISLGGVAVAATSTMRTVLTLQRSTGKTMIAVLKGLNRTERKRLTEEIIRANNPGISNHEMKALIARNIFPKRYRNPEISASVRDQLIEAVNAALGVTGSATSGVINEAMSISPKDDLVFGVANAFETM
jgi:hypothetical protein